MGFHLLPFLTLTLCPQVGWGAERSPWGETAPEEATAVHTAQPESWPGRGLTAAPWSILPRLFIPYSVTFLFYFTLIMIIQEYYLSDKFRVSFSDL